MHENSFLRKTDLDISPLSNERIEHFHPEQQPVISLEAVDDKSTVFTLGEIGFNLDENFSSCVELWLKIVKPALLGWYTNPIPHDYLEKLINTESLAMDSAKYLVSQYHSRIENLQTLYFWMIVSGLVSL